MLTAPIGVVPLGVGCAGYLYRPLARGQRVWAALIMPPLPGASPPLVDAVGLALVAWERRARLLHAARRQRSPA
jgi:ABC-type Fe3+ transport system permease subunit